MVAKNSDGLVREVARQVKARAIHLPEGMKQRIMIDVRGQSYDGRLEDIIASKITSMTEGIISPKYIEFVRK